MTNQDPPGRHTRAETADPLANTEIGDDDPIGPFDEDHICGAEVQTYPGARHRAECLREPHPASWVHIDACDDLVDYVWRELAASEFASLVLTGAGVACRECGWAVNTGQWHYAKCPGRHP